MSETLIPPDKKRCQTIRANGTFMSFGPVKRWQCRKRPVAIISEKGKRGSMSVCSECLLKAKEEFGPKLKISELAKGEGKANG